MKAKYLTCFGLDFTENSWKQKIQLVKLISRKNSKVSIVKLFVRDRYSFHGKFVNLNCIICFWFVFTEKFVKSTCTCKSCLLVLDLRHLQTIYSIWFERLVCLSLTPFFWKIPFWVSQFMLALVQVYFRNEMRLKMFRDGKTGT